MDDAQNSQNVVQSGGAPSGPSTPPLTPNSQTAGGNVSVQTPPNQAPQIDPSVGTPTPVSNVPTESVPSPPQPEQTQGEVVTMETEPKGSTGRKLLVIMVVLLILVAGAFAAWRFWPRGLFGLGNPGEIVWWGLWEDESIVNPLIEEYENNNRGVTIKYEKQSPQDYRERLMNSLAKNEGPDMFRFHNTWVPMLKNELDLMPTSVMTPQAFAENYYPVMSSDLTSGTGIVGIPLGYDALALYINEEMFSRYGKQPPKTWDDFREVAMDLTIKNSEEETIQYGAAIGAVENVDHWQEIIALMLLQNGADLSKPDKQVDLSSGALAFYKQFVMVDKVWDETLPPSTIAFANGQVAMYFGPTWRAFEILNINKDLKFRTVPVPQLPKQSPTEPDVSYASYWVEGVWTRSANKDIAWDFLKYISSKESLEKLYKNASNTRLFGEPYPRVEMADSLKEDPIVGSVINLAPNAKSWFMVSRTFDGETGINSRINAYYEDLVNSANNKGVGKAKLKTVTDGVAQILSQYGLAR
jgi:multiple sugar transport system substrate-binding protein